MSGGVLYAWRIEPIWVRTVPQAMPLAGLGSVFEHYRLVQISDLHCGESVPAHYLARCVDQVNALNPDLVVVTGDLIHRGRVEAVPVAADVLRSIRAKDGVIAILGNHDHNRVRPGSAAGRSADAVTREMRSAGIRLLRNESCLVERGGHAIRVVGLDDYWSGDFDVQTAFSVCGRDEPVISLCHNPDGFQELLATPAQWTLAGHTHGGQVKLPGLGPLYLPVQHTEFASGLFERNGRFLYVNCGLGWLSRMRFGVRPEITLFELRVA